MPFISQIGIVNRYVRSLQISDVLNIMNDLIDYSRENGMAPAESMAKFPRFGSNVSLGKNLDQKPEEQHSSAPFSAPYFSNFSGAGSESGFCGNGLGNTTASNSMEPNNQKRQRIWPNNPNAETPAQIGFSTPSFDLRPQVAHTALGKSGQELAAENVQMEIKTSMSSQQNCHSNLGAEPNNSLSTVERIIQEVMAAQPYNGAGGIAGLSVDENKNGNMPTGSNNGGGNPVASNGIVYIDVENYEFRNNGKEFSAPASGASPSAQMDVDVFPQDPEGNYLPQEVDNLLLDGFVDFEGLHELLK